MKTIKIFLSIILVGSTFATCKKDKGMPTVIDVDGNVYHTVKIGTQTWMVENLKTTHYRNGDAIINSSKASMWVNNASGAYCDDLNRQNYAGIYGHLYNWLAVSDVRKLAPEGWHTPSKSEWETLINYLGGEAIAGGKVKESGTVHWKSPNTGATNSSRFTALPGGQREDLQGTFNYNNDYAAFWSSTTFANDPTWAWITELYYDDSGFNVNNHTKNNGLSVRCIKD